MALPTPRSYQQILSDMLNSVTSEYGIESLRVGGPILSVLEASAQSDLRNTQDMFSLLSSTSLDRATGIALDRIGLDEKLPRLQESASSGYVTVTDSSFNKVSSVLYQGAPAPIVGSLTITVRTAQTPPWDAIGSLYIGRGTPNYEGPIAYNAITFVGGVYEITLATATTKFHNVGESVVMAQGGDRTIAAGTVVQTTPSSVSEPITFSVVYGAVIPDGDNSVENVLVTASLPGVSGNVASSLINQFASAPFVGAAVINPLPFTNAVSAESDDLYRERIRTARQNRAKGTVQAIKNGVLGIIAADENKRVASSSYLSRPGEASVLYIDDGNGYEERDAGVPFEILMDSASGGEQYFQLRGSRPVSKARLISSMAAPYNFGTDIATMTARSYVAKLAVSVGGIVEEHIFEVTDFISPSNASAYEIVASINADPDISFIARTIDSGTKVVILAREDVGEDIQIATTTADLDANTVLVFSTVRDYTLRLYKDGALLTKDGVEAKLVSNSKSDWTTVGTQTLILSVDNTPAVTYTFEPTDFINAGTGYATITDLVPVNAWATVFNYKIPGITASVESGRLVVRSNRGESDTAALAITGGTLVSNQVFVNGSTVGDSSDYELDRNLGQIKLRVPLAAGERLTAGSEDTRAFIEAPTFTTITPALGPEFWFIVDSPATIVTTDLVGTSELAFSVAPTIYGSLVTISDVLAADIFANVAIGDWIIIWDAAFIASTSTEIAGAWRVSAASSTAVSFEHWDAALVGVPPGIYAPQAGIKFVRSDGVILHQVMTGGTALTPYDLSNLFTSLTDSVDTSIVDGRVRLSTQTMGSSGSIALVAQNTQAEIFGMTVSNSVYSYDSHRASIQSETCLGTPDGSCGNIITDNASSSSDPGIVSSVQSSLVPYNNYVVGLRNFNSANDRWGTNRQFFSAVESNSGTALTLRYDAPEAWTMEDRLGSVAPVSLSAYDTMSVLVDGDSQTKNYDINMFRNVVPADSNYSASILLNDSDFQILGIPQSLSKGFGNGFKFEDFALFMHARAKSHTTPGPVDTTKTVLWRSKTFGLSAEYFNVSYEYPALPSSPVSFFIEKNKKGDEDDSDIRITLASEGPRTMNLRNSMRLGVCRTSVGTDLSKVYVLTGVEAVFASSNGTATTLTLSWPAGVTIDGAVTVGGLLPGDFIYFQGAVGFAPGNYVITSVNPATDQITYSSADPLSAGVAISSYITVDAVSGAGRDYDLAATGITDGDIFSIPSNATGLDYFGSMGLPSSGSELNYKALGRIDDLTAYSFSVTACGDAGARDLAWYQVMDKTAIYVFALDGGTANTIDNIAASVNALPLSPLTAVAVSDGTLPLVYDTITKATWDEYSDSSACYPLTNGLRYIQASSQPGGVDTTYQVDIKGGTVLPELQVNADWTNEELRLVPVTSTNFVDYLNTLGVTGLSSSAEVTASDDKHRIQLTSNSVGGYSSICVQNGAANLLRSHALSAPNIGISSTISVPVRATEAISFDAGQWVKFLNDSGDKKSVFGATTQLDSIDTYTSGTSTTYLLKLSVGEFFSRGAMGGTGKFISNKTVVAERIGKLMAYSALSTDIILPQAGEWVWMYPALAPYDQLSAGNRGFFRVVSTVNDGITATIFVDNPNGVSEMAENINGWCFSANSILPGDTMLVGTSVFGGAQFKHTWRVVALSNDAVGYENNWSFSQKQWIQVAPDYSLTLPATGFSALGASYPMVVATGGINPGWVKRILSVVPDGTNADQAWMKFADNLGGSYIKAGSTITAMDRLGFSTDLINGIDGYRYNTGLIREANKVVYGDERDSTTYPGIAAAGANINIQGPFIRRVTVSLAIRARTGISKADLTDRVRSAVAAAINKIGVGQAVAISDVVSTAAAVSGVIAVTVLAPEYATGHDLIGVQAYEKPMVLDSNNDIQISFIGE